MYTLQVHSIEFLLQIPGFMLFKQSRYGLEDKKCSFQGQSQLTSDFYADICLQPNAPRPCWHMSSIATVNNKTYSIFELENLYIYAATTF